VTRASFVKQTRIKQVPVRFLTEDRTNPYPLDAARKRCSGGLSLPLDVGYEPLRPLRPLRLLAEPPSPELSGATPVVTAATVRAALFAMSAVAATISPLASIAPAATPVPTAIASVTGLATAAPKLAVRRVLCAPLRFDAPFAGLCLRDALALFDAAFVDRKVDFAAVRPRALAPPRALDATVFAVVLLRDAAVLDTLFLEAAVFFVVSRPRALAARRDLEAVVFDDLAMYNSFLRLNVPSRRISRLGDLRASTYSVARVL
jgi:hypothetical protein